MCSLDPTADEYAIYTSELSQAAVSGTFQNETSSSSTISTFHVIYYVVDIGLAVLAIIGNLLIVLAFINNRRLRIISHFHLISLAISDFLMGSITIPIWLAAAFQGLPHSCRRCLMGLSTVLFVDLAAVFSLLTMTIDRYLFICWPLFYNTSITPKRTLIWIICTWILAGIFIIPMPFTWKWSLTQTYCHLMTVVDTQYLFSIFIICILLPIILMSAMYGHIFALIRQKVRHLKTHLLCISHLQDFFLSANSRSAVSFLLARSVARVFPGGWAQRTIEEKIKHSGENSRN